MTKPTTEAGKALLKERWGVAGGVVGGERWRLAKQIAAIEAEAVAARNAEIRAAVDTVLSDEPTLDPVPASAWSRWYSEGWNRCARDVRAAVLTLLDPRP